MKMKKCRVARERKFANEDKSESLMIFVAVSWTDLKLYDFLLKEFPKFSNNIDGEEE